MGTGVWRKLAGGFGFYFDNQYTVSAKRAITATTRTKVTIDALRDFREFNLTGAWNTATNKITAAALNSAYHIRFSFVGDTASAGTYADIEIDAGGVAGVIIRKTVNFIKGTGIANNFVTAFPVFVGPDFLANGAEIFITTNNNINAYDFSVYIQRTF